MPVFKIKGLLRKKSKITKKVQRKDHINQTQKVNENNFLSLNSKNLCLCLMLFSSSAYSTQLSFSKGMLAKFVSSLLASLLSLSLILKYTSVIHMSIRIKDYISDLTVEVGDHVG